MQLQLLTNDVSTGAVSAVKPPRGGGATLVNELGLAEGDTGLEKIALFSQECRVVCSRGNKILLSDFSSRGGETF